MPLTTLNIENAPNDASTRRALTSLSAAVFKSRRIVVVTGAGISCSCGIPDFRSSDGLYNLVKQQYPDVVLKGRDLFDASLFRDKTSTAVFFTFISGLKAAIDKAEPSPTHHFLTTLDKKGKLLRSYTQNIDGLEERSGLTGTGSPSNAEAGPSKGPKPKIGKDVRNIQLHGDIHRVRCTTCSATYPCSAEHMETFQKGSSLECPECKQRCDDRVARSARPLRIGNLRPAIVLYDEAHPLGDDIATIQTSDLGKRPDLLIIMGTSLKVHGLKKLVKEFAKAVKQGSSTSTMNPKVIFVNKTAPAAEWSNIIDTHVEGTTDEWVERVTADWKHSRPVDWESQPTLREIMVTKTEKALSSKTTSDTKPTKPKAKVTKRAASNEENIVPSSKPSKATVETTVEKKTEPGKKSTKVVDKPTAIKAVTSTRIFASATGVKNKTKKSPKPTVTTEKEDALPSSSKGKEAVKRSSTPPPRASRPSDPPLSPSKRQNTECHYSTSEDEGASHPRKRQRSMDGIGENSLRSLFNPSELSVC